MTGSEIQARIRLQLWCQNYDPEPQGIAAVTTAIAKSLMGPRTEVLVVTSHPHYPKPDWGVRIRPYKENRDGVQVLRLPIWPGRDSALHRIRQDLSSTAANTAVAPILPSTDVVIAVSPSLPALFAAMLYSRLNKVPWILWLQDIVTDGARATDELNQGNPVLEAARWFEKRAYKSADHIIVISDAFRARLHEQGVPPTKVSRIYNPMTRTPTGRPGVDVQTDRVRRILVMGNIGRSQGLELIVDAFESAIELAEMRAELVITGTGVAFDAVSSRIRSTRVSMLGVVPGEELDALLRSSALGLVSQKPDLKEFNLPSKLMNYMAYGIPIIASVDSDSETARIVRDSGAGWVTDPADPGAFARRSALAMRDPEALGQAAEAGLRFADENFARSRVAMNINGVVRKVIGARSS